MSFALKFGFVFEFFWPLHRVFFRCKTRFRALALESQTDIPTHFALPPPPPSTSSLCKGQQLVTGETVTIG